MVEGENGGRGDNARKNIGEPIPPHHRPPRCKTPHISVKGYAKKRIMLTLLLYGISGKK